MEKKYDIRDRCLTLAIDVAKIINKLPYTTSNKEYGRQVIRSSASIGANVEEADGTLTKKDFINKMVISRKEARETKYWLKLIKATTEKLEDNMIEHINLLIQESEEIKLILSSIINKTKDSKC